MPPPAERHQEVHALPARIPGLYPSDRHADLSDRRQGHLPSPPSSRIRWRAGRALTQWVHRDRQFHGPFRKALHPGPGVPSRSRHRVAENKRHQPALLPKDACASLHAIQGRKNAQLAQQRLHRHRPAAPASKDRYRPFPEQSL